MVNDELESIHGKMFSALNASFWGYEESASADATYAGFTGTVGLVVANTNDDDFGFYAGDGAIDSYQVAHFGLDNPSGLGNADPDADGQDNTYESIVNTQPTNVNSLFVMRIEDVPGVSTQADIIFDPTFTSRTYTVEGSASITGPTFAAIGSFTVTTNGTEQTVRDLSITNNPIY